MCERRRYSPSCGTTTMTNSSYSGTEQHPITLCGSIRGRQLPQNRGDVLANFLVKKNSQWVVDFNDFNNGRLIRICHVAGINNPFEFIHGKSDSAQLRIGGGRCNDRRKTLKIVASCIIEAAQRHITVRVAPKKPSLRDWLCVAPMTHIHMFHIQSSQHDAASLMT